MAPITQDEFEVTVTASNGAPPMNTTLTANPVCTNTFADPSTVSMTCTATDAQAEVIPTPVQEAPKQPTLREYKNMMRQFFTVRRPRVNMCGHKYNENDQPRTNCEYCWIMFFQSHGEMVATANEIYMDQGKDILISLRGAKFTKMFCRFMATLAHMKAMEEKLKELNDQGTEGTDSNAGVEVQATAGVGTDTQQGTEHNQ